MKKQDLIIGQEYYFDCEKVDKGVFKGFNDSGCVFFEPIINTSYIEETDDLNGFIGCVGFVAADSKTPVNL